jgi:hypothetical protein
MSKLTVLVSATALACCATTLAQSAAPSETELPQLVSDCNGAVDSAKRRAIRACETLEQAGRLSLVEPAAATAYLRYQDERLQACQRRQASPRGQSRGETAC